MGLNTRTAPMASKDYGLVDEGSYPARLVQVIDLGLQPNSYNGEEKAPVYKAYFTYEFCDEFLKDDEGNDDTSKPRWLSEEMAINNLQVEKANSTKRYNALDPKGKAKGDFVACIGFPVMLAVGVVKTKKGKDINKILGTSVMREKEAAKLPDLVNPSKVFSLDDPDLEVFGKLPAWLQDRIVANLEYAGSPLAKLLGDSSPKVSEAAVEAPEDDSEDSPF